MSDESDVRRLYHELLNHWNRRDAGGFSDLFSETGHVVGFDGTQVNGRADIASHLRDVFGRHPTGSYVGIIRDVDTIVPHVAICLAVAGMVPAGEADVRSDHNAVQTLVATEQNGRWQIALFQNTPATLHGRPDEIRKLTDELRQALHGSARGSERT